MMMMMMMMMMTTTMTVQQQLLSLNTLPPYMLLVLLLLLPRLPRHQLWPSDARAPARCQQRLRKARQAPPQATPVHSGTVQG
jgi:hypothetical protein